MLSVTERFWIKVDRTGGPDSCWIWTAAKRDGGYGVFCIDKILRPAHRVSYEWAKGPIPEGYEVDHLCYVTSCVNPAHLEAVTPRVNKHRARRTIWRDNAAKTHCPSGHEYTPENTYIIPSSGSRRCRACIKVLGDARYRRGRTSRAS